MKMGRPIVFLALLFTLLALVSAELSINTPFNQPKGSKVAITWTWDGPDDAKGSLLLRNKNTGNSQILLSDVLLNQRSYQWNVDADPGTYNLILQGTSQNVYSGDFQITAGSNSSNNNDNNNNNSSSSSSGSKSNGPSTSTGKGSTTSNTSSSSGSSSSSPTSSSAGSSKSSSTTTTSTSPRATGGNINTNSNNAASSMPIIYNLFAPLILIALTVLYIV